ncbi:MAG: hypothetical protein KJO26_04515, partial [Deltaproteobacteria bacterium]|nr:hypothetical protein [Deltaproteobacteria bacterium]
RLKTDEVSSRLTNVILNRMDQKREQFKVYLKILSINKPISYITKLNNQLEIIIGKLYSSNRIYLNQKRSLLRENTVRLYALNPTEILKRGFSITSTIPQGRLVKSANSVSNGQDLEIMLAKGKLLVRVFQKRYRQAK